MIGIFDSGIGGLTVVRALMEAVPGYPMIYFGDTARSPYGNKSPDTVIRYAIRDTEFLLEQGARLVVMACNTASSLAFEAVRQRFPVPVFEVVTPAARTAVESSPKGRIGVIGTRATVASGVYEARIRAFQPAAKIVSTPCPLLVPLVEEGWLNRPETRMIVKKYLRPLKDHQIDTLILGCTHYPLLKSLIQHKIGKQVRVIDSSVALAGAVKAFLHSDHPARPADQTPCPRFYVSDRTPQFETIARSVLCQPIRLEHVPI